MTPADFEILQHMMNGAKPPDFAVRLLEDTCERTGLSWKARHVYLQSRRNRGGDNTWTAVLSIDGFRAVGSEHPDYAGQEGPFWTMAPESEGGTWSDIPPDKKPYAAKVGIKKKNGITTWGIVKFAEYAVTGPGGMMWEKFPGTMIAKCAEMLAWRKTFPRVFGGLYGTEELAQSFAHDKKEHLVLDAQEAPKVEVPPGLRDMYKSRLENAGSYSSVVETGKEIQSDKRLETSEVMELHMLYGKMKAKHQK